MPFDATGFRPPTVTVLPPTLREPGHDARLPPVVPERRGGEPPRRVHIVIEIEDRRPSHKIGRRWRGGILWWLLALAMALFGCTTAHAQPTSWQSRQEGFVTRYEGQDGRGGTWTGTKP